MSFLQLSVFSAILVLSESVLGQLCSYSGGELLRPLFAPCLYLALSCGSFFSWKSGERRFTSSWIYLASARAFSASLIGFSQMPSLSFIWGVLPFFFFGYILNILYITILEQILQQEDPGKSLTVDLVPFAPQHSLFPLPISDQYPFHLPRWLLHLLLTVLVVTSLVTFGWMTRFLSAGTREAPRIRLIFYLGSSFVMVLMGLLGKAQFIIGNPGLAPVVVLFSFYVFSLPGGIWAVNRRVHSTMWCMLAAATWIGALLLIFHCWQAAFIKLSTLSERAVVVAIFVAPFSLFSEIPYIALLSECENGARGRLFTYGKLGSLFGVIVGLCLQMLFGYEVLFLAALGFALLALKQFYSRWTSLQPYEEMS